MFGGHLLHRGGQCHQAVEQCLVGRGLVVERGGDVGQLAFGLSQFGAHFFGDRQAPQGHEAVGFQLQQALRNAASAAVAGARRRHHQDAFKTTVAQLKVGSHHGVRRVAHARGDHRVLAQPAARLFERLLRVAQIAVQHDQFDGRKRAPRNAGEPAVGQQQVRQQLRLLGTQARVGRQRLHQRVTGEFGVALPLEGVAGQAQAHKVALHVGQRQVGLQAAQVFPFLLAADAVVEHAHQHDERRQADAGAGPRVHFVVHRGALRVVGRQQVHGVLGKWAGRGCHCAASPHTTSWRGVHKKARRGQAGRADAQVDVRGQNGYSNLFCKQLIE